MNSSAALTPTASPNYNYLKLQVILRHFMRGMRIRRATVESVLVGISSQNGQWRTDLHQEKVFKQQTCPTKEISFSFYPLLASWNLPQCIISICSPSSHLLPLPHSMAIVPAPMRPVTGVITAFAFILRLARNTVAKPRTALVQMTPTT